MPTSRSGALCAGSCGARVCCSVSGADGKAGPDAGKLACADAAGFLGSEDYVTKAFGVEVDGRTNVKTASGKYSTNVKNVFTAGDMHRGQSLVVWAIREGREAACAVDLDLMGYTNLQVQ